MRPSELNEHAPPRPQHEASLTGFFAHHGAWAPGVRLFRLLNFKVKAALVSIAFLCPMIVLAVSYYSANNSGIEFAAKERLGVEFAREAMPVLKVLEGERLGVVPASGNPTREPSDARATLGDALKGFESAEKRLGNALGTEASFAKLEETVADVAGAERMKRSSALDTAIDALLDTWGVATDGSNLTLDPDMDSYYVMDAATGREPQIIALIARLRVVGADVLTAGDATPAQMRMLVVSLFRPTSWR